MAFVLSPIISFLVLKEILLAIFLVSMIVKDLADLTMVYYLVLDIFMNPTILGNVRYSNMMLILMCKIHRTELLRFT